MRFCPKCGKKITSGTFCEECRPKAEETKIKEILVCKDCGRIFLHNRWTKAAPPKDVKLVKAECNLCGKKNSQYFEGVLQVRNVDEELLAFLDGEFEKAEKENIFVTAYKKHRNGYDYYLTSKKFIVKMVHALQQKFGGIVKVSEKLFTRDNQKSKNVYRVNALFSKAEVSKGDIVVYDDKVLKITSVGKIIFGQELGKKSRIKLDFDADFRKLEPKVTSVVKVYPDKQALNPSTYQAQELVTGKKVKLGMQLKVVSFKNKLYLV